MDAWSFPLLGASAVLIGLHVLTCLVAGLRLRTAPVAVAKHEPMTIVVSIAGLDAFEMDAAFSALALAGPTVELVFCAYDEAEPAVIALRRRLAFSPAMNVRVCIGRRRWSRNPKLDNIEKAFDLVRTELVVFADGNVRLPLDFPDRLLAEWNDTTGAVTSPPQAANPEGFWAEVEYAMLNPLFARYQIVSDWLGAGYVHGKVFMMRHSFLAAHGGMKALDGEPIEDGAATRLVRAAGQRIKLTRRLFEQPLGRRLLADVWQRNLRWAQQRRYCYPVVFVFEPLMTGLPALALAASGAAVSGVSVLPVVIATSVLWYGSEAVLALLAGWEWRPRSVVAAMTRDVLAIGVWCAAWFRTAYVWRGQPVNLSDAPTA
ncbi:MAG TPA: glycosyltransferase [Reyranella sp.]|nr:glycosyltransferase [Reyranella sp.]